MKRANHGWTAGLMAAVGVWLCTATTHAAVVASWNFNALGSTVAAVVPAQNGSGTVNLAEFTSGVSTLAGTDVNALSGDLSGMALALTGLGQNGKSVVVEVATTGFSQLSISLASRRSASGFAQTVVEVWNGNAWLSAGTFDASSTQWQQHQFSLAGFAFLNHGEARIRLRVDGATSSSGNIRFDNVRVDGTAVPGAGGAAAIAAAAMAATGRRGARAQKTSDGVKTTEPAQSAGPLSSSAAPPDKAPSPKPSRVRSARRSGATSG